MANIMGRLKLKYALLRAKLRIWRKSKWTTGSYARNRTGFQEVSASKQAVSWCLIGSFSRQTDRDYEIWRKGYKLLEDEGKRLYGTSNLANINDHRGHRAVMKIYNRAMVRA